MSLESWKAEFYPTEANSPEAQAAPAAHSLRKWLGTRPEALERHGVVYRMKAITTLPADDETPAFDFDADNCALCVKHSLGSGEPYDGCSPCTLSKVRGDVPCDTTRPDEIISPWREASPEPMIYWLMQAAALEAAETPNAPAPDGAAE